MVHKSCNSIEGIYFFNLRVCSKKSHCYLLIFRFCLTSLLFCRLYTRPVCRPRSKLIFGIAGAGLVSSQMPLMLPSQQHESTENMCVCNVTHYGIVNLSCRELLRSEQLAWIGVTVHGFADSPVTWAQHEHGYADNGDNLYTVLLLPTDQCWLYTATGTRDLLSV